MNADTHSIAVPTARNLDDFLRRMQAVREQWASAAAAATQIAQAMQPLVVFAQRVDAIRRQFQEVCEPPEEQEVIPAAPARIYRPRETVAVARDDLTGAVSMRFDEGLASALTVQMPKGSDRLLAAALMA